MLSGCGGKINHCLLRRSTGRQDLNKIALIHPFRFIGQATKNGCLEYNFHCSEADAGEVL